MLLHPHDIFYTGTLDLQNLIEPSTLTECMKGFEVAEAGSARVAPTEKDTIYEVSPISWMIENTEVS